MTTQPDAKPHKRTFNPNYIGLVILMAAYGASMVDVMRPPVVEQGKAIEAERVVNFLHWQLEPGFREALDAVIADYNALPHVREAGYAVRQMAVTERVYKQFLNVHLISGTAPDMVAVGLGTMATNRAQFLEPFIDVLDQPNPYNADAWLPEGADPGLRAFLPDAPWRETFTDGLQTHLDANTGHIFTVPVASWGTVRLYVNTTLLAQSKALLRAGLERPVRPAWLAPLLADDPDATPAAMLPDSPQLRAWAAGDAPPQTFGQLILLCEALREHARLTANDKLVPIAGSSYSRDTFVSSYNAPLFHALQGRLDLDGNGQVTNLELFAGFERGLWDFNEPRLRAFFDLQVKLAGYFPAGFLGLDREQANRRFILGNAMFLATGAWDAAGIFIGARSRLDPAGRFEVAVAPLPLPVQGERWGAFRPERRAEVSLQGVSMGVYKRSRHKTEALDFLRYLTGMAANQKFVQSAGWLPAVIGPEPVAAMKPFQPDLAGVSSTSTFTMGTSGNVMTLYNGQFLLLVSGDTKYPDFVDNVTAAMRDPRNGMDRQWHSQLITSRDNVRSMERSLSVQRFHQLLRGDTGADAARYTQVVNRSSGGLSGTAVREQWRVCGYERPFPEF